MNFGTGYFSEKAYGMATFDFDLRRYGIPYAALFEAEKKKETFGELPPPPEKTLTFANAVTVSGSTADFAIGTTRS